MHLSISYVFSEDFFSFSQNTCIIQLNTEHSIYFLFN